jgi:hypothetical protein
VASPPPPPPTCEQGSSSPECSNVSEPSPPPPPGPIDCSTSPNDPSCKTTPGGPVDCNTNPNDLSCGPQPPVDCKTKPDDPSCTTPPPIDCKANPNDPSCKPDCTKNPDEPSCKVDCTTNPNDPSCPTTPPCQSSVIGISCPPVDCTKNPDDPSCPPIHIDCPERVGFTLRAIENGKCVYDPIKCKQDEQLVNNKCSPSGPDKSCLFHPEQDKCKPDENGNCPVDFFHNGDNQCVPDKKCPKGFEHHDEDETGTCYPIPRKHCPNGFHQEGRVCVENHHDSNGGNTKVIVKTKIEIIIKNFIINNFPRLFNAPVTTTQPNVLLLLDTGQLCSAAGDTACVVTQNQFKTFNIITKLNANRDIWTISGQVQNIAKQKTLTDIRVIAHFYDSKGGNVGGLQQVIVNPSTLKALQIGVFNIKAPISQMSGTPTFLRLEYQSTTTS